MTHPYASEQYACAFEGIGVPLACPGLGTWVLVRAIPGTARVDGAGGYPLAVLHPQADLSADVERLRERGIVSLALVADPFFGPSPQRLQSQFDVVRPFKRHFVHDYARAFRYGGHHRYEVKRAHADCEVRAVALGEHLAGWTQLYRELCARHGIEGLQRFSPVYFARLAELPGLHALAAWRSGTLIGMHLFVEHEGVAYSHLAAFSEEGYRCRAGYALNDHAIVHFSGRRLLDFGGAAGAGDAESGLARFKRGFANAEETVHLCGKVVDGAAYDLLCRGARPTEYFPAYRGA
jgi:hypothetical protein